MTYVRTHAGDWKISPDKIGIIGVSRPAEQLRPQLHCDIRRNPGLLLLHPFTALRPCLKTLQYRQMLLPSS